jgi:hypothetical protein
MVVEVVENIVRRIDAEYRTLKRGKRQGLSVAGSPVVQGAD